MADFLLVFVGIDDDDNNVAVVVADIVVVDCCHDPLCYCGYFYYDNDYLRCDFQTLVDVDAGLELVQPPILSLRHHWALQRLQTWRMVMTVAVADDANTPMRLVLIYMYIYNHIT